MADETGGAMQVDTGLVRQLAELLDETNLTEIEVQDGARRIRVAREVQLVQAAGAAPLAMAAAQSAPAAAPALAAPSTAPVDDFRSHPGSIKSPMVGTVYLAPEPGAANFVAEGASVNAGDTLLIIEAMKVMNPITAPKAGRVAKICVANEQPVEFDQPLIVIE